MHWLRCAAVTALLTLGCSTTIKPSGVPNLDDFRFNFASDNGILWGRLVESPTELKNLTFGRYLQLLQELNTKSSKQVVERIKNFENHCLTSCGQTFIVCLSSEKEHATLCHDASTTQVSVIVRESAPKLPSVSELIELVTTVPDECRQCVEE